MTGKSELKFKQPIKKLTHCTQRCGTPAMIIANKLN